MSEIIIDGFKLTTPFALTQQQSEVLNKLIHFLFKTPIQTTQSQTYLGVLTGQAGTGKTSILRLLLAYNNRLANCRTIAGCALTHKARKVLAAAISTNALFKVPTHTVSALLKKQRLAGFVGTRKYGETGSIISNYNIILIDEVSMISDVDYHQIIGWAKLYGTKILFIGDSAQIPHPTQELIVVEDKLEKRDCSAFELPTKFNLSITKRQSEINPLVEICDFVRNNLRHDNPLLEIATHSKVNQVADRLLGVMVVNQSAELVEEIERHYQHGGVNSMYNSKIICYTNRAVCEYNRLARSLLYGQGGQDIQSECGDMSTGLTPCNRFYKGEILMGYENIGFPDFFIENGQEYQIMSLIYLEDHPVHLTNPTSGHSTSINHQRNLSNNTSNNTATNKLQTLMCAGYKMVIEELVRGTGLTVSRGAKTTIFCPDVYNDRNMPVLNLLIGLADKVNGYGSTVEDFKRYQNLKEQLIFTESLYKWDDQIIGEQEFIRLHPLLRTRVTEVINEEIIINPTNRVRSGKRSLCQTPETEEIAQKYGHNLLLDRLKDLNVLGDNEELKDKFQLLSKDLDYGYAITAHKSQGSTYQRVFIDGTDFDKIRDRWNYRKGMYQSGCKERNQLKYVALTRASEMAVIRV